MPEPTPTVIDSDRALARKWYRCGCGATYGTIMESEPAARQRQRHARPDGDHHHVADEVESMASEIAAAREAWGRDAVAGLVEAVDGLLAGHDRGELPLHRVIEALRAALERVKEGIA